MQQQQQQHLHQEQQPGQAVNASVPAPPSLPRVLRERDYGALEKSQFPLFVQFFRQASPYIEGHRGRTFVLAIPGEVVAQKDTLHALLEDVALLHGLGVKLVVVIGARPQINAAMREQGVEPRYEHGYRVTDADSMQAAIRAAGYARMEVESRLSKGPAVTVVRRHARGAGGEQQHYGPALQTVTGNYVAAKRKGVVGGVDYQLTGVVRFVQSEAVRRQLGLGAVVLLSNLGYSAAGEVLNCDIYTVAARAAIDLHADKLIVMTTPESQPLDLPLWLPLSDAEALLRRMAPDGEQAEALNDDLTRGYSSGNESGSSEGSSGGSSAGLDLDFDRWYDLGLPPALLAACAVCRSGVKRAHLVDARIDGGLLLELYSRDGVGCMISTDFYEGIRRAGMQDLAAIQELLRPLEERGVLVRRSEEQLLSELPHFTVLERESKVLGCAAMKPLGRNAEGDDVAELGAFVVHASYRGGGKGDSLLEYLEADAAQRGIQRLVLLTTRTADWFEQRGFKPAGAAHLSALLPEDRRARVDPARNSQLFSKRLSSK
ncbi:hypothetical protein ABPG77_006571 [Micractinium sp. CCAP 211/92]